MSNTWLLEYRSNVTSHYGEDGMLEEIFKRIGVQNPWCIELGALNGTHDSNVWNLIVNNGWSGVLIEADLTYFEQLKNTYKDFPKALCINEYISFEGEQSLDSVLSRTSIPKNLDLLSLDIDGSDYHVWESLVQYRPRVVVIEFNPSIPDEVVFVQSKNMQVFQGSSLAALVELGKQKGYELIAVNGTNAFFVLRELFPKFEIADNSLRVLHVDHSFETKLFQLYDGTLMISGNTELIWHKLPIDTERLQVLPKHRRVYPARISQDTWVRELKFRVRKWPLYSLAQKVRKQFGL